MVVANGIEDCPLIDKKRAKPVDHQALEIAGGNAAALCMVLGCPKDKRPRDVISIARSLLDGVARRQPFAGLVKGEPSEEAWLFCV